MGSEFMHQFHHDEESNENMMARSTIVPDQFNRSAAGIITKILKVFYHQWKDADYFKEKIKKELYISLNKKLEDSLEEMIVTKLIVIIFTINLYIHYIDID